MAVQVGTDDNYRRDVFVEMIMCCPTLPNCGSAQSVLIETHDTNLGYRGTALVGQILPNNNSINSNHLASQLNAPVTVSKVSSCFFGKIAQFESIHHEIPYNNNKHYYLLCKIVNSHFCLYIHHYCRHTECDDDALQCTIHV